MRNTSGKASTNRAENIFPKYLLYHIHEIARKYPREKTRSSSFCDSVEGREFAVEPSFRGGGGSMVASGAGSGNHSSSSR